MEMACLGPATFLSAWVLRAQGFRELRRGNTSWRSGVEAASTVKEEEDDDEVDEEKNELGDVWLNVHLLLQRFQFHSYSKQSE